MLFAGGRNWFGSNFSLRAVLTLSHYRLFVVWAFLAGGYFYVLLTALTLTVPLRWLRGLLHLLSMASCVMLGYAVFIPYLPDAIPRWAALHVALAAGSCVVVMLALLLLLVYFRRWRLLAVWAGIAAVSALLLAIGGRVTSALEVFFCLSAARLLYRLWATQTSPEKEDHP